MAVPRERMEELIYGKGARRFTQDSPVLPDVWIEYGKEGPEHPLRQQLLLTPVFGSRPGVVARLLRRQLGDEAAKAGISYNQTYVAVGLELPDLVRLVLPMTQWWRDNVRRPEVENGNLETYLEPSDDAAKASEARASLEDALARFIKSRMADADLVTEVDDEFSPDLLWMMRIVAAIQLSLDHPEEDYEHAEATQIVDAIWNIFQPGLPDYVEEKDRPHPPPPVWQINRNRVAETAVKQSTLAVKADAARRLFRASCKTLAWGVIDNGIDARHPAFFDPEKVARHEGDPNDRAWCAANWTRVTRVKATYDFTRMRDLLDLHKLNNPSEIQNPKLEAVLENPRFQAERAELRDRLDRGRPVDWEILKDFLEVPHDDYEPPGGEHGTHVAGILAANWPRHDMQGVCPDIGLYDFRVLNPSSANDDEFAVLAALQFVQYLNDQKDFYAVHGVNVSLAIRHEVANFACGRTPVCDECERLVSRGVVVVAAAGNDGYLHYQTTRGEKEGYNTVSITDPGNASRVLTVGSTHRFEPHTYGVSYFSSRGPTGDGRIKPDLVAPGEKIEAPVPNARKKCKDGTSMAAPHVSGAAALLMARHREFIGQPDRVKEVLCSNATDLGRERYFQGAGMLDVLRALQSV